MRRMLKYIRANEYVAITPDGPRGPAMRASTGIISTARLSGAPIVPITYATRRRRLMQTWDRFHLPLPFSEGIFIWGEPLTVPTDADEAALEAARALLEARLNALTAEADRRMGHAAARAGSGCACRRRARQRAANDPDPALSRPHHPAGTGGPALSRSAPAPRQGRRAALWRARGTREPGAAAGTADLDPRRERRRGGLHPCLHRPPYRRAAGAQRARHHGDRHLGASPRNPAPHRPCLASVRAGGPAALRPPLPRSLASGSGDLGGVPSSGPI